jgi:opacity protein-like surface antigen
MQRLIKSLVISAAVTTILAPTVARADGYVNPWAGINFGSQLSKGRGGFGVSAGSMGAGVIGGEATFGYSPSFFGTNNDFGTNTVIDLMGNLIVGVPVGGQSGAGFRPYFTAGLGLIRTQIDGGKAFDVASSNNKFGWNAGIGVLGFVNDHVGLRGDVRYLRTLNGDIINGLDLGGFHFWRTSVGLVIR